MTEQNGFICKGYNGNSCQSTEKYAKGWCNPCYMQHYQHQDENKVRLAKHRKKYYDANQADICRKQREIYHRNKGVVDDQGKASCS